MKKAFVIGAAMLMLTGCGGNKVQPTQPGSFFPNDEQRYILVDQTQQHLGLHSRACYIYADKYSGVMYLLIDSFNGGVDMMMLTYEDGSPMIYDNDEGE